MTARQTVLAKYPDAMIPYVGDYEILRTFGSHRAMTEDGAWRHAATSLDDYQPGAEYGYRKALEWVLGKIKTSLGELQPEGVCDYNDAARGELGDLEAVIELKRDSLGGEE